MSIGNIEHITKSLIRHGKKPTTPVAVIEWGTTSNQRTITGQLETISEQIQQEKMVNPSMILVGDVVGIREEIAWFNERIETTC